MRKLNLTWLVGLVIGSIVLVGLSFGLHRFQMARNASAFVQRAKRAQADKRFEDAAFYLSRYVKLAPKDNEGLILLGMQLADLGRVTPAFLALEKAIRIEPDRNDVRRRLVELAMQLGRFSDAIDHLQKHLLKSFPDESELLDQLARCQIAKSDYTDAEASLNKSIEKQPKRLEPYFMLAVVLNEKLERTADADAIIKKMVDENSENYRAYLLRAQWQLQKTSMLTRSRRVDSAIGAKEFAALRSATDTDIKQSLTMAPDDVDVLFIAARISQDVGRSSEAREHLEHAIQLYPKETRFYSLRSELESASGNPDAAIEALRQGLTTTPNDYELNWSLANLLIDQGDHEKAAEVIQHLRDSKAPETTVKYLEARSLVRRKEWLNAIAELEAIRPMLRETTAQLKQVEYMLCLCYREIGSFDDQIAAIRRAISLDPQWIPARLAFAESLISINKLPEALNEYEQVCAVPGAPNAAFLGKAKTILMMNRNKPAAEQKWSDFEKILSAIREADPSSTQASMLEMEKLLVEKSSEAAMKAVQADREKNPDNIDLWTAQVSLAQLTRDWNLAESTLDDAVKKFGDIVTLRNVRGRYLVARYGTEAKTQLLPLSVPPAEWTADQRIQLAAEFSLLFLTSGDFDNAEKQALIVSHAEPSNLRIRVLLLDILMRANKSDGIPSILEQIKDVAGEGAIWHYAQAIQLMQSGQQSDDAKLLTEALAHLQEAQTLRPNWERIPALSAEIYERQGEINKALEQYSKAIELGEASPVVASRALSLMFKERRFDDAEKLIHRLHESNTLFTEEMARAEISLSLQRGRKDEAIKATETLMRNSKQAQDPMWLGEVYATLRRFDEAEEQFSLATKANPENAQAWINLVRILKVLKKTEKAEAIVAEAKAALPANQSMLAIAQCYEVLSKPELARTSYEEALQQNPNDSATNRAWVEFLLKNSAPADSETALRKMIKDTENKDEVSETNQHWANRKLASILMSRGGREKSSEALALVRKNLSEMAVKSDEDSRIEAYILSMSPSKDQRKLAQETLEGLIKRESPLAIIPEDRLILAGLYSAMGDRAKARAQLRQLIAVRKDDPRPVAAYAQLSLQSGETNEAELYLTMLEKLAPNELSTADLKSQLSFAKGNYSAALALLKSIGEGTFAGTKKLEAARGTEQLFAAQRLERFARLLGREGKNETSREFSTASENFYTQFTSSQSLEPLVTAELLAHTSQIDRALELLKTQSGPSSANLIANVTTVIMHNTQVTDQQLAQLQEILTAQTSNRDSSVGLSLVYADLLAWRGQIKEATRVYQSVLQRDEKNIVALNNLAYLMSLTNADSAESLRLVERAIKLAGPNGSFIDTRGVIHLTAGNPTKAVLDFEFAIKENESAERHFHAALALSQLPNPNLSLAKESLDRANALGLWEKELHPLERPMLAKLREKLKANGNSK